jgi:hypothetical protein
MFCTPYRASVHPISLRRATSADELSSGIRQSLFPSFAKHRIDIDLLTAEDDEGAVVLQRGTAGEVLGKMQSESWYATWYGKSSHPEHLSLALDVCGNGKKCFVRAEKVGFRFLGLNWVGLHSNEKDHAGGDVEPLVESDGSIDGICA